MRSYGDDRVNRYRKLRCLIVEDDSLAIDMLRDYIGRKKELILVGVVYEKGGIPDALKMYSPDIVFLDLIIPAGKPTNFNFSRFPPQTCIVVVSAIPCTHFFETLPANVMYELPKPVSFENFNSCIRDILYRTRDRK